MDPDIARLEKALKNSDQRQDAARHHSDQRQDAARQHSDQRQDAARQHSDQRWEKAIERIHHTIAEMKTDIRGLRSDARTDFRVLFGVNVTTTLGLAALSAKGFGWI